MTPAMLAAWHDEHYVPQNAILGIAGDVKPAEMIAMLKKSLGEWKRTAFEKPNCPPARRWWNRSTSTW